MDNIKIVRLQNGDDVIADYQSKDDDNTVLLTNPMCLVFKRMPTGRAVMMMSPWLPLELVTENTAWIYNQDILSIFQPKADIIEYYTNTVKEVEEDRLQEEMTSLNDISGEFNEMSEFEMKEQEMMEDYDEFRSEGMDTKKRLLH